MMTLDELNEKYSFMLEDCIVDGKLTLHPTYKKWLPVCWIIENIYGHVECGNISLGKARELTAAAIEEFSKEQWSVEKMEAEFIKLLDKSIDDALNHAHYSALHPDVEKPIEHNEWKRQWLLKNLPQSLRDKYKKIGSYF